MANTLCLSCGGEISESDRECRHCGALRHRVGSPDLWAPPGSRRVATIAGMLIALLIVAALAWTLVHSRRTPLAPPDPVLPTDGERRTG